VELDNPTQETLVVFLSCIAIDMEKKNPNRDLSDCIMTTKLPEGWNLSQIEGKIEITLPPRSEQHHFFFGVSTNAQSLGIKPASALLIEYKLESEYYRHKIWTSLHTSTLRCEVKEQIITKVKNYFAKINI
jgi:hypothetical protein